MSLAAALKALKTDAPLGFAIGVVTDASPFTIQINGEPTDIIGPPVIGTTPGLGDTVFVLRPGASIVVLGTLT